MFKCPHCHQKAITFSQKFNLVLASRNRNYQCKNCGELVTVSFALVLLSIPLVVIPLMLVSWYYNNLLVPDFVAALIVFFGTISAITFIVPPRKLKLPVKTKFIRNK